jgi:hypothetical protein
VAAQRTGEKFLIVADAGQLPVEVFGKIAAPLATGGTQQEI